MGIGSLVFLSIILAAIGLSILTAFNEDAARISVVVAMALGFLAWLAWSLWATLVPVKESPP